MNLALAFDDLLTDPRLGSVVDEMRAALPAWLGDQFDAAADDTMTITRAMGQRLDGAKEGFLPATAVPDWLRLSLLSTLTDWILGKGETCRHNPHSDTPQPLLAAAWRPGLVACTECVHLFRLVPGSDKEATCDGCGHRCTGPDNDDGIHPAVIRCGLMVFQYGACRSCVKPIAAAY